MGKNPLLSREEEVDLIKKVEVFQNKILAEFAVSPYGRNILSKYLKDCQSEDNYIVDLSKRLDEESSSYDQEAIVTALNTLLVELECANIEGILTNLEHVALSGNHLFTILTDLKKKHAKISEADFKIKQMRKSFDGYSFDEMFHLVESNNEDLRARIKSEQQLSDVRVSNKMQEWSQNIAEYKGLSKIITQGTIEEVKDLFAKIDHLEREASMYKDILITRNLKLVVSRAKDFMNKGLDFEDLIQEGNLGLMKAVGKFDSSKKTKISTYAVWWIDQSIRRAISNKGKTVRVPTHIEWQQTNLNKVIQRLTGELKRPPTLKEISAESGLEVSVLEDLHNRAQFEVGLEEELSSGLTLLDILPADTSDNPFTHLEQKLQRETIREVLSTLSPKSETILRLRYGIGEIPDDEGMTLQAIADDIGITKQGVRVRECSALRDMVKGLKTKGYTYE